MATKETAQSLLREELGKEAADAVLNGTDQMAKEGVSSDEFEEKTSEDLATKEETKPVPDKAVRPVPLAVRPTPSGPSVT